MEILLKNDFTVHYGLSISTLDNFSMQTNASYFELNDDTSLIYTSSGQGIAKYRNPLCLMVTVINYETFLNSLPHTFLDNREKCDLIVYTANNQYFLLNELTDTNPQYVNSFTNNRGFQPGKRVKAISQLLKTLTDLGGVLSINTFIASFTIKRCCFFNKQISSPPTINATSAFNRINTIAINGFQMSNPDFEEFGFELYEYSGGQVFNL
jgi:hypothetical protein